MYKEKILTLFPRHTQKRVDIVITIDSFETMANVFIIDLISTNLVYHPSMTTTHATSIVALRQNKILHRTSITK
jgi:hypothetical protein